jgi:hypothetical protein
MKMTTTTELRQMMDTLIDCLPKGEFIGSNDVANITTVANEINQELDRWIAQEAEPMSYTVGALIKHLQGYGSRDIVAYALWQVEDVLQRADERALHLSVNQAEQVLMRIQDKWDASIGISWDTLDFWTDEILEEGDEDDGQGAYECQECGSTCHPSGVCPNVVQLLETVTLSECTE